MFHVKDSQHLLGSSEDFIFSSIRHYFLSWKDISYVSAMYDKMSLSVATPFQTWETPSTGSVTVCCMSSFIFPKQCKPVFIDKSLISMDATKWNALIKMLSKNCLNRTDQP